MIAKQKKTKTKKNCQNSRIFYTSSIFKYANCEMKVVGLIVLRFSGHRSPERLGDHPRANIHVVHIANLVKSCWKATHGWNNGLWQVSLEAKEGRSISNELWFHMSRVPWFSLRPGGPFTSYVNEGRVGKLRNLNMSINYHGANQPFTLIARLYRFLVEK